MPLTCLCPHCRKMMSIGDEYAGQAMRCPMCQAMFQAPPAPAAPAAPAPVRSAPPQPPAPQRAAAARSAGPPPRPQPAPAPAGNSVGNDWPWMNATTAPAPPPPKPAPAPGEYDWGRVPSMVSLATRLAPGWHTVLRGSALITPGAILVFLTLALCWLFLLIAQPGIETRKIVMLVVTPLALLGALTHLAGWVLCCLAPGDLKSRAPVIAGVFGVATAIGFGALAVLIPPLLPGKGEIAPSADPGRLAYFQNLAAITLVLAVLAAAGSGIAFLLFLRRTAATFQNKRLTQHILYFTIYLGAAPVAALLLYWVLSAVKWIFGLSGDDQLRAFEIVLCVCELVLTALTMTGFLLLLRDVRATVERAIAPSKG